MQTTINKKKFIDALTIGGAMAGKAKTMPILEFTKVVATTDTLTLYSFDTECGITKRVPCTCSNEGEFAVNAIDLVKVLKSLVEEEVTFSISDTTLTINHIKGTIEMPIMSAINFPSNIKGEEQPTTLDIATNKLQEWVGIATNFAASDDLRPIMCGMYLYSQDGKLGMCATDAHKLYTDSIDSNYSEFKVVIPMSAFKPLLSLVSNCDMVSMSIDNRNITFATEDSELCCRLVEGAYPNFRAVIPQNNPVRIEVSKAELVDSITRASLMANKTTSLLKLSVSDMVMGIEGSDLDFSKKAKESVAISKVGNDVEIGVKSEYFSTCLSAIASEDVVLRMCDSQRAIVFDDAANPNKVVLVMPMMIN